MENTIFVVLFFVGCTIFLSTMGVDVIKLILNFIIRCLIGLITIGLGNFILGYFGLDFFVKINEITAAVSGILGIWGVILLYVLQYYFTML